MMGAQPIIASEPHEKVERSSLPTLYFEFSMKRITPTRGIRLTLVVGVVGVCVGVAGGQARHGGGGGGGHQSAPAYHPPAYHPAPAYHAPAPQQYHQAAPQSGYRPAPQQSYAQQNPAPVERRAPGQGQGQPVNQGQRRNPQPGATKGEHLAEWMNQHRNLTPQQQQQALDKEPGFRELPQATQDRMHNRLSQLNAMPPEQRERILNYNERMEHMSVDQRTEVRGSLQQLGALPADQRRQVAQTFRNLRALPPDQRGAALNSPEYQYMNPAQKSALNNLLRVEPLLPPTEQNPR